MFSDFGTWFNSVNLYNEGELKNFRNRKKDGGAR